MSKSCAVCKSISYLYCGCPWKVPFQDWPDHKRAKLLAAVHVPPMKNSPRMQDGV